MGVTVSRRADAAAVDRILRSLPDWFGDEPSIVEYVGLADTLVSYVATDDTGQTVGVALVSRPFPPSANVDLIAVDPEHHRRGIGSALIDAIVTDLRSANVRMLQVRTVGPSSPNDHYGRTRQFYLDRGFIPIDEFHKIDWDGWTLVLVKPL